MYKMAISHLLHSNVIRKGERRGIGHETRSRNINTFTFIYLFRNIPVLQNCAHNSCSHRCLFSQYQEKPQAAWFRAIGRGDTRLLYISGHWLLWMPGFSKLIHWEGWKTPHFLITGRAFKIPWLLSPNSETISWQWPISRHVIWLIYLLAYLTSSKPMGIVWAIKKQNYPKAIY